MSAFALTMPTELIDVTVTEVTRRVLAWMRASTHPARGGDA